MEPTEQVISSMLFQERLAFWIAMAVGATLRVDCVVFRSGTGDLDDCAARGIHVSP